MIPVLVLHHEGDPQRDRVWRFCRNRWQQAGFPVVTGSSPRGLYAARNVAARAAGDWKVAVFADADYALNRPDIAAAAVEHVGQDEYMCLFSELHYLDREATERFISGGHRGAPTETVVGMWLGCFAIGRALFDDIGGFDERFAGRAGQDVAFLHAASTLGSQRRLHGAAFHLWHDPVKGRVKDTELLPAYIAATGDRDKMLEVLRR